MRGWRPDPYGVHEYRFFSADGAPTRLVMDGAQTSHDSPPDDPPPSGPPDEGRRPEQPAPQPAAASRPMPSSTTVAPDDSERARTPFHSSVTAVTLDGPLSVDHVDEQPVPAETSAPKSARTVTDAPPNDGQSADAAPQRGAVPLSPSRSSAYEVPVAPDTPTQRDSVWEESDRSLAAPPSRGRKIAYGIVLAVLGASLVGLFIVHFPSGGAPSKGHVGHAGHAARATTTTSSRPAASTTTTAAIPSALKPDPDTAASALVSSWASGNRATALTVASPSAVAALFAAPYKSGLAEDRGCSTAFSPIVCTFGPPGGASPTDAIYQIDVSQASGGWYVSAVKVQN